MRAKFSLPKRITNLIPKQYFYDALKSGGSSSDIEKLESDTIENGPREDGDSALSQARYQTVGFMIGFWLLLFCCTIQTYIIWINQYKLDITNDIFLKSPAPKNQDVLTTFKEEESMMGLKTVQDVHKAWDQASYPSGFIHLSHPEVYSQVPNKNVLKGIDNVYMISAYHQLHCLRKLHVALFELQTELETTKESLNPRHGNHEHPDAVNVTMLEHPPGVSIAHVEHCFSYLKQGLMCAGDITLEGPDSSGKTLKGWGTTHQCRRFEGKGGLNEWAIDQMKDL
ncbi:hypothetical protein GLAREA_03581 [Glarea lozoyensis ATCC 20868]|uniref:Uncharacterized protein n=1 Tax=Glarea lozoyensis (strain ATCC 20868 / MF5171) TaxID=1116229 RepID=S3D0B8_GLAL2|nr:uncharacterized protein GLAREA_03581 [Glarea lozoyensis ATCC 20868]EPE30614.1 hypothetical protein GLAREA_03581 [Glarea lozoyensis ATCC 20868]